MGWILVRPDGTLRAWNRNAQDDVLREGEFWVEWPEPVDLPRFKWNGSAIVPIFSEYWFHLNGCRFDQLLWEIEDKIGLRLMAYEEGDETDGYANGGGTDSSGPYDFDVFIKRPLTTTEQDLLAEVVAAHIPRARLYRGNAVNVVTRYSTRVGRLLVRNANTGEDRFASGFLFDRPDLLMTAAHVIDNPWQLQRVEFGEVKMHAKPLRIDTRKDIAILRLERPINGSPLRVRHVLEDTQCLGLECVVVGFPDIPGMEPSVSVYGVRIASVRNDYLMGQNVIERSTHLGSGASGAPVMSKRQNLVGMVVGYPERQDGGDKAYPWPKWTPVAVMNRKLIAWRQ